jgi:hypothetical protein
MVDGVVVEHEARIAFRRRCGRDRSRSCRVGQGQLSDRVFPFRRGTRAVRVRYVPRPRHADAWVRWTPCRAAAALPAADRRLLVEGGGGQGAVRRVRVEASPTSTSTGGRIATRAHAARGRAAVGGLSLRSPGPTRERGVVEKEGEGRYCVITVSRKAPPSAAPAQGRGWASSGTRASAATVSTTGESGPARTWLRRAGDIDVDVVVFRNVPEMPRSFAVRGGQAKPLLAFLEGIVCRRRHQPGCSALCLGPRLRPRLQRRPRHPGRAADDGSGHLRGQRGRAGNHPCSASLPAGRRATSTCCGSPRRRRPSASTPLACLFSRWVRPDRDRRRHRRVTMELPDAGRPPARAERHRPSLWRARVPDPSLQLAPDGRERGRLVGTFWAQRRVAELSVAPTATTMSSGAWARVQVVTPGMSPVLETVDQYVEHRIEPPLSRPMRVPTGP